jgi:putative ABC transport system substrate-binding protein
MKRREFITLIAGAAAAWPLAARAQQGERRRRVGVLIARPERDVEGRNYVAAFEQGLQRSGWIPGRNLDVDYRWTAGDPSLSRAAVHELVATRPDLLVINSTANLFAAKEAAGTTPIVMAAIADPVTQGFVQSLARPGANITGFSVEEPTMGAKWVELLKEAAPQVRHITAIFNPGSSPFAKMFVPSIEEARTLFSFELAVAPITNEDEVERAVATAARQPGGGLLFLPDSFLASRREAIAGIVAKHKIPAIYSTATFVRSGGLIGYGFDRADIFYRAAGYVDRILKGANPAELPVQTPVKFELAINLGAAKALSIELPPTLIARADEVIE